MNRASLLCALCLGTALPVVALAAPRVVLTQSMVSDIKEVAAQATQMEEDNRGQLEAIANIKDTMETIGCADDTSDAGCKRAQDSLRRAYIDYLQNLEEAIPGLRESLSSTVRQLKREVSSLARENSLADIQGMSFEFT